MEDYDDLKRKYENVVENKPIFDKARSLIKSYGETDNIPWGEIKGSVSGFDVVDLLTACAVVEEKSRKQVAIH